MMGDKPIEAQREINYLNSQSKMQLQFAGIQDRADMIMEAKKYVVKESLSKEVLMKEEFLKARVNQFKQASKFLFDNGLPSFWDDAGLIVSEDDYLIILNQKKMIHQSLTNSIQFSKEDVFLMCWIRTSVYILKLEELFQICHHLHTFCF